MRLHELAHTISADVQLVVNRPEHRLNLLQYVLSGFDQNGMAIVHSQHQIDMLRCLDCPKDASECPTCKEVKEIGRE